MNKSALQLRYQRQDSAQTLRDGLAEYRRAFSGLFRDEKHDPTSRELLELHQRCHVLFGCGASVQEEVMADVWILVGTTLSPTQYLSCLALSQCLLVFQRSSLAYIIVEAIAAAPLLFQVARRAHMMTSRWPFQGNDQYLDIPLCVLRDSFNIRLVRATQSVAEYDGSSALN